MGIEGFLKTLQKKTESGVGNISPNDKKQIRFLHIDFNSILYNVTSVVEEETGLLLCHMIYYPQKFKKNEFCMNLAKKYDYDLQTATIESYVEHFNGIKSYIDQIIIEQVKKYIVEEILSLLDANVLEYIYISFDGIPTMAKIIEQKHRKYMGFLISDLQKKIYTKYNNSLSTKRKIVTENKYKYDRGKLVTWSSFMTKMNDALCDQLWQMQIKKIYKKINETGIEVSGPSQPGEGEGKIMDKIIMDYSHGKKGKYLIVSPDADLILLALILTNISIASYGGGCYVDVLNYNQQDKKFIYVNTSKLRKYLCNYIITSFDVIADVTQDMLFDVSNDFVLIATLFGNDFVPRILSINVKTDLEKLLDQYRFNFEESNDGDIIHKNIVSYNKKTGKFELNFINFEKYLANVSIIEENLIVHKFLLNNYDLFDFKQRMKKVKKHDVLIESADIVSYVEDYINDYGIIIKQIKQIKQIEQLKKIALEIQRGAKNFNYGEFIGWLFVSFEKQNIHNIHNKISRDSKNLYVSVEQINATLQDIYTEFIKTGKNPIPLKNLKKRDELFDFQIDAYKSNSVVDFLISEEREELTEYDYNMLNLEWKRGEYKQMLNANLEEDDNAFGFIGYDNERDSVLKPKINYGVYNEIYLKVKSNDTNNIKLNNILNEYIKTFCWIFDQYFNKHNFNENISVWFYNHERAPLVKNIYDEIRIMNLTDKHPLKKINMELDTDVISELHYFNKAEHLLYTVPLNNLMKDPFLKIPENQIYLKFVLNHQELFPDIGKIANEIWKVNENKYIDCKRITFTNKCILNTIKNISAQKFIDSVRHFIYIENKKQNKIK